MCGVLLVVVLAAVVVGCTTSRLNGGSTDVDGSPEERCRASGGTVETWLCCTSTGDFPDLCGVGPCGCAPQYSHEVQVCDCGEGMCFDGETCVPEP